MLVAADVYNKFSLGSVWSLSKIVLFCGKIVGVGSKLANCVFKSTVRSTLEFET